MEGGAGVSAAARKINRGGRGGGGEGEEEEEEEELKLRKSSLTELNSFRFHFGFHPGFILV